MSSPKRHPDPILSGKICQYCNKPTVYVDSSVIYNGVSYGMVYHCADCDAYCGVHRGTDISKGSVANKDLRDLRKKTHGYFDQIWPKYLSRSKAYKWLQEILRVPADQCHIGMFTERQCVTAIEHCRDFIYSTYRMVEQSKEITKPIPIEPKEDFPWQ